MAFPAFFDLPSTCAGGVRVIVESFRNFYLLAGLRGGFQCRSRVDAGIVEGEMLHTFDERWGVPPPWGACDSGADLDSPGDEVLRGWCHVDLRITNDAPDPADAPLAGLLRSMWDALELFGECRLSGVDAIVPLECIGESMSRRVAVAGTVIRNRHRHAFGQPARVLIQASDAWPGSAPTDWDFRAVVASLSDLVDVQRVMDDVPFASYPPSFAGLHSASASSTHLARRTRIPSEPR